MNRRTDYKSLCYLAGIMDGEGHFCMTMAKNGRGKAYKQARMMFVQSTNNNGLELCLWAKARYGGNISKSKASSSNPMYRWQLTGTKATLLTKRIRPFLIVKKAQVLSVL